ncbi:MAG TPA: DUF4192 domain-containing protein [Pseudonocardiaceae bacterium]
MTTDQRPRVRLRDHGELLASLPHLLGFHPENSLVVVTLLGKGSRRVGACLRTDLVPSTHHRELAEQLVPPVRNQRAAAALLIVVGGAPAPPGDLPERELVTTVERVLGAVGTPVMHSVWTANTTTGAPWSCYHEPDCGGVLPDPRTTPTAAATALAGMVTFTSRAELAALLRPDDEAALIRRSVLMNAAHEAAELDRALAGSGAVHRDLVAVQQAVTAAARGRFPTEDDELVRLAVALSDPRVRDACLVPPDPEHVLPSEQLWLTLTRALPPPERAEPAALLAFAAYLRGDGALASVALDVAEQARPGYRLVELLRRAIAHGIPAHRMARVAADAAAEARAGIEQDGAW